MVVPRRSLTRIAAFASIIALLLLSGCGSQPVRKPQTYVVRAGDTVYSIAWRHGVDYHELARVNHIGRDFHINIGQVLLIPQSEFTHAKPPANKPVIARRDENSTPTGAERTPSVINSNIHWIWPALGKNFSATTRPNGGKGLLINGNAGQDVKAAAPGKVVYAGTGLLGYGQLLIIKHDEVFLSAYGHTQDLYVHEGDSVTAGQKIATMGKGPDGTPQMYFEIRSNGSPVSPLSLLPQQR